MFKKEIAEVEKEPEIKDYKEIPEIYVKFFRCKCLKRNEKDLLIDFIREKQTEECQAQEKAKFDDFLKKLKEEGSLIIYLELMNSKIITPSSIKESVGAVSDRIVLKIIDQLLKENEVEKR